MTARDKYVPGPATGAEIEKEGETWTLVLIRDLKHAPSLVWEALTDPKQLAEWAPFDPSRNLSSPGAVQLKTIGAPPAAQVAESVVKRAQAPTLLEYTWGGNDLRWELEARGEGTRLKLWHNIERGFITWGAAGWHICLDVLDHYLAGDPLGRIVGPDAFAFDWQRLVGEYAKQFGVQAPSFPERRP